MSILKIESAAISYGAIHAVRDVSIEINEGEIVTIIGANGAGKSTLLKGVAGLEPLLRGSVHIGDVDCTRLPAHRRVRLGLALSPEGRGVFPDLTVYDNLMLGAHSRALDGAALDEAIAGELDRFPRLRERRDQTAGTLSGGEQQMLAMGRALMSKPKLLLLDEPSLGLAPLIIADIFRTIRRLRDEGLTILLVEQMAKQALAVSDRAYVLENGVITVQGSGVGLLNDPKVQAAYLGGH